MKGGGPHDDTLDLSVDNAAHGKDHAEPSEAARSKLPNTKASPKSPKREIKGTTKSPNGGKKNNGGKQEPAARPSTKVLPEAQPEAGMEDGVSARATGASEPDAAADVSKLDTVVGVVDHPKVQKAKPAPPAKKTSGRVLSLSQPLPPVHSKSANSVGKKGGPSQGESSEAHTSGAASVAPQNVDHTAAEAGDTSNHLDALKESDNAVLRVVVGDPQEHKAGPKLAKDPILLAKQPGKKHEQARATPSKTHPRPGMPPASDVEKATGVVKGISVSAPDAVVMALEQPLTSPLEHPAESNPAKAERTDSEGANPSPRVPAHATPKPTGTDQVHPSSRAHSKTPLGAPHGGDGHRTGHGSSKHMADLERASKHHTEHHVSSHDKNVTHHSSTQAVDPERGSKHHEKQHASSHDRHATHDGSTHAADLDRTQSGIEPPASSLPLPHVCPSALPLA